MLGHQRGQDADHHDVGAVGTGLSLGVVETGPHVPFQVQAGTPGQQSRRHIEFDVVGAQFGLVGRIADRVQYRPIRHGGLVVAVDKVAFDFHPGERLVGIEAALGKHRLEDVETDLHLAPVFPPVCAVIRGALDLFAHNADATGLAPAAQVRPG